MVNQINWSTFTDMVIEQIDRQTDKEAFGISQGTGINFWLSGPSKVHKPTSSH